MVGGADEHVGLFSFSMPRESATSEVSQIKIIVTIVNIFIISYIYFNIFVAKFF